MVGRRSRCFCADPLISRCIYLNQGIHQPAQECWYLFFEKEITINSKLERRKMDPKQVAKAILTHAQTTSQEPSRVLKEVADGDLVVVIFDKKSTLLFNSPNGL